MPTVLSKHSDYNNVDALMFDKPVIGGDYRYDFSTWVVNPDQPSEGIVIDDGSITITKFKPNIPILVSNYTGTGADNTPTASEICAVSKKIEMNLSGFDSNSSYFTQYQYSVPIQCSDGTTRNIGHVNPYYSIPKFCGLYFAPYYTLIEKAMPFCVFLYTNNGRDGTIKYSDGSSANLGDDSYLRGTRDGDNLGFGTFYHRHDLKSTLTPDWTDLPSNIYKLANEPISQSWDGSWVSWATGPNAYWQLAVILFTNYTPDADGTITLDVPIVIRQANNYKVNPCSVEGYKSYIGSSHCYSKAETLANTLIRHGLASVNTNQYTRQIQGLTVDIYNNGYDGNPWALVVDETVNYNNKYDYFRFPVPTDMEDLIKVNYPIKFFCTQYDEDGYNKFWRSVIDIFKRNPITNNMFAQCLFTFSNIKGEYYGSQNDNDNYVELTFNMADPTTHIVVDHLFDYSKVDKVKINVTSGNMQSLLCMFRQTKSLTNVQFYHSTEENHRVLASQWSGSFEGSSLVNWPSGLGSYDNEWDATSRRHSDINYGFDGSKLSTIGLYKDENATLEDDKYYTMLVGPYCAEAFRGWTGTEIRFILDMAFVNPNSGAYRVFDAPNVTTMKIKNLNKGNWSFDGVTRNNTYHGNLTKLNADSINYLLNNVYDLTSNNSNSIYLENELNSFNSWSNTTGTKRSVSYNTNNMNSGQISKTISTSGNIYLTVTQIPSGGSVVVENNNTIIATLSSGSWEDHAIPVSAGSVVIKCNTNNNGNIDIKLSRAFRTEVSTINEAIIYCPSEWSNLIDNNAASTAEARGWRIFINNVETSFSQTQ